MQHRVGLALLVATAISCRQDPTPADYVATSARIFCSDDCWAASASYVASGCAKTSETDVYSMQLLQSVYAGRTRYDSKLAATCLQQLDERPNCGPDPLACWSVFAGTLQNGATCSVGPECLSGSCAGSTCPKTCQPAATVPGAPCPCEADYPLVCKDGACVPLGFPGSVCSGDADCSIPYACKSGQCSVRSEGDACSPARPCSPGPGLYCDTGTCKHRLPAGASCLWKEDVLIGLQIGVADVVGFGVNTYSDSNSCAEGLTCIGGGADGTQPGTCGALSEAGGPCIVTTGTTVISGCRLGLVCVGGRCEVPPPSGACLQRTCDVRVSFCDASDQCVPYLGNGSLCGAGYGVCASGNCVGGNDMFPGKCEPAGACASN